MPEKTITKAPAYRGGVLPPRWAAMLLGRTGDEGQQRVQCRGEVVDRRGERSDSSAGIEQVRDRAQQVAEQATVREHAWDRVDAHVDQARPNREAEQIETDRLQRQVEHLAGVRKRG